MNANHLTICKFADNTDANFELVAGTLNRMVAQATETDDTTGAGVSVTTNTTTRLIEGRRPDAEMQEDQFLYATD